MLRNLTSLLIVIFFANALHGQGIRVVEDMHKVLISKDFIALQAHIDSLPGANWECLRDLTEDFKEGVLFFGYIVKDKDNPAMGTDYTFRVNLITTKSRIAYYELSAKKYKKVGEDWLPYYDIIDNFKDDTTYKVLKASFRSVFHTNLNESELFITDFVYGKHCSISGNDPEGKQQIDEFVAKKDKLELLKWLQSTNTEKQIYAVDGLNQLKRLGIKLTEEDMKMIKFVTSKKGTMSVCSGCIYSMIEITEVTKRFEF